MDREAAIKAFGKFLDGTLYNSKQIEFINHVIDHLAKKGVLELDALFKTPFTDLHYESVFGLFRNGDVSFIKSAIEMINKNVDVAVYIMLVFKH